MKKVLLLTLALCAMLNAQGIVIKDGAKEEIAKPLENNKVKKVEQKLSVRDSWTVDDTNKEKIKSLKERKDADPYAECH